MDCFYEHMDCIASKELRPMTSTIAGPNLFSVKCKIRWEKTGFTEHTRRCSRIVYENDNTMNRKEFDMEKEEQCSSRNVTLL